MTDLPKRTNPGVYVTEFDAFPPSIVGVQTAVPIFIGYTETAVDPGTQTPAYLQPAAVTSMADYAARFGGRHALEYGVQPGTATDFDFEATQSDGSLGYYRLLPAGTARFNLFAALSLFYDNGGGDCFVVSVANYQGEQAAAPDPTKPAVPISKAALLAGLAAAQDQAGPSMLVVPDACLLPNADYGDVAVAQVRQAGALQDRLAILDLPGAIRL